MKVYRDDESDVYPAWVLAYGRCWLCGRMFDFGAVGLSAEIGESDGDICPDCAVLAETNPDELRRRMLAHSRRLRGRADELAACAEEVLGR